MLTIGLSSTPICKLYELNPGDFFVAGDPNGDFFGVRIQDVEGKTAWLILTGKNAFTLHSAQRSGKIVLKINLPNADIKLRIDNAFIASNRDHRIGQLVVGEDNEVGIAAIWPELADKNYKNTVRIDTWSQSNREGDAFLFDRWVLSCIDETGQWVDIFRRDP